MAELLEGQQSSEVDVVLDAFFIKAWSIRHPIDNQTASRMLMQELAESGRSFRYLYAVSVD